MFAICWIVVCALLVVAMCLPSPSIWTGQMQRSNYEETLSTLRYADRCGPSACAV